MSKYDPLWKHPVGGGVPDVPHYKRETGRRGCRPLRYIRATEEHAEQVTDLVQETIKTVYPNYYPKEVVDFFCDHHGGETIEADIKRGNVWILFCDRQLVGTGCSVDNHITRVYVLPTFQGKGYGSYIMRQLEDGIGEKYNEAVLDASLPAVRLYEKLGYKTVRHEKLVVENGVVLVYEVMKKELHGRNHRKEGGTNL